MFNMGDQGAIMGKLESLKASIEEVIRLFRDPVRRPKLPV